MGLQLERMTGKPAGNSSGPCTTLPKVKNPGPLNRL